jgi:hypothetical protein
MQSLRTKYKKLDIWLQDQIVHYFNNALSSADLIVLLMNREFKIELEQEIKIVEILGHYNTEYDKAPCDPEGATEYQEFIMDRIFENCSAEIIDLLIQMENNQ